MWEYQNATKNVFSLQQKQKQYLHFECVQWGQTLLTCLRRLFARTPLTSESSIIESWNNSFHCKFAATAFTTTVMKTKNNENFLRKNPINAKSFIQ